MFLKRLIVIIILVPLMVWLILGTSTAVFQIFSAIFSLLAAWEWATLMKIKTYFNKFVYLVFILAGLSVAQFIPFIYILWGALIWWLLAIVMLWCYVKYSVWPKKQALNMLIGMLCIIPAWVGLNSLRSGPNGAHILLLFLFLLWAMDSGAYLAGLTCGKNKLLPKVSPNKTIEGLIGGLLFMLIFLALGMWILDIPQNKWLILILISIIMCGFSVIGDLFESMYKRIGNVKDSGALIPGHGGVLDRIDSILAAAPIFALAILIFGIAQ